ncbi:iron export ABC transporter permease subunit FetB [Bacillus sp. FJAT-49736]|uniref:ABC transporter permease n=1 Tax=Bacillus sp. FJAT-49736 TaxID=2833582 RepID=UPI001BC9655B|nr:iron export ABC transporter permease subunit FetB [Bacillus sp. FJAT-49736]MBS4173062.1 iron export ABC transporter permease subunit FetB [Bacillus sp. FJAT-49736]
MNTLALILSFGFVFAALILSKSFKLGLGKDLIITAIRATVQLLIIGYVLKLIFGFNNPFSIIVMLLVMIYVAARNAVKRAKGLQRITWKIFVTILIVEAISMSFMIGCKIIPATPQYIIPISGMIIGNSMVIASLYLNRLKADLHLRKQEVILRLSLGSTPKQAIFPIIKDSIRSSLIPTIESQRTIGLVQLPGMMTGQIVAGADPIHAVRLQLLIVFMIMSSAAFTGIILGLLIYPSLFNKYQQLEIEGWE